MAKRPSCGPLQPCCDESIVVESANQKAQKETPPSLGVKAGAQVPNRAALAAGLGFRSSLVDERFYILRFNSFHYQARVARAKSR